MDLTNLTRLDLMQVGSTARNTMRVYPLSNKKQQKIVVGDSTGVVQAFGIKRGDISSSFKTLPTGKQISRIELPVKDRAFVASSQTIRGISKKGKEFFLLKSNMTETIHSMAVEVPRLWLCGEYLLNTYTEADETGSFMSPDKINDIIVDSIFNSGDLDTVLACQDRIIRVLKDCKVLLEIDVEGPVISLWRFPASIAYESASSLIIYGTENGYLGMLAITGNSYRRKWSLQGNSPVTAIFTHDIVKDGKQEIIIGRDDGMVEVFAFDIEPNPVPLFHHNLQESVTSIAAGLVTNPVDDDIIACTYSGKIIAFSNDSATGIPVGLSIAPTSNPVAASNTNEGVKQKLSNLLGQTKLAGEQKISNFLGQTKIVSEQTLASLLGQSKIIGVNKQQRISTVVREIEKMQEKLEKEKLKYQKLSEQVTAVHADYKLKDRFVLDSSTASYTLSIELDIPIDIVALQSDVEVDLLPLEIAAVITTNCPTDASQGSAMIATFRCTENVNRVEMKLRSVEGRYGTLQAFIIPSLQPKACQVMSYYIKPLSLHERVFSVSEGLPLNTLTMNGSFSMSEIHAWICSCLPGVPERQNEEEAMYMFRSSFQLTTLIAKYKRGEATFQSDNVSTLSILKEFITKEATTRKIRINVTYEINDKSFAHVIRLLHPKMQYQVALAEKFKLVEALKEIHLQEEGNIDFLDDEAQDILHNAEIIKKELKQQPRRLEFLKSIVTDLFLDRCRFRGESGQHGVRALHDILNSYSVEALVQFFHGAQRAETS